LPAGFSSWHGNFLTSAATLSAPGSNPLPAPGKTSITRNPYSPFHCETTEATVAAIFAPLLKVGVMTDISGGSMTNSVSLSGKRRGG
jgi:hypothetical protein